MHLDISNLQILVIRKQKVIHNMRYNFWQRVLKILNNYNLMKLVSGNYIKSL